MNDLNNIPLVDINRITGIDNFESLFSYLKDKDFEYKVRKSLGIRNEIFILITTGASIIKFRTNITEFEVISSDEIKRLIEEIKGRFKNIIRIRNIDMFLEN